MAPQLVPTLSRIDDANDLPEFCEGLFATLPRSEQRKWGEVYVRGLLSVPGRKSARRISDHLVGWQAQQSLQQFVNQSPWRWDGVRGVLARQASAIRPTSWIVQEVIFPKTGRNSVGVARQYAPSADRTLNCQLGLAIVLANGGNRCAVNWRLLLPKSWDDDRERRTRARVPAEARHLPRWRHVIDAIEEMTVDWGLRPAPVVWDSASDDAVPLMTSLTASRLPYLLRVPEQTQVLPALTVGDLAALSLRRRQILLRVRDRLDRTHRYYSQLFICDVCPPAQRVHLTSACEHGPSRCVVSEWSLDPREKRLSAVWLTNVTNARLVQLADLITLSRKTRREDMDTLRDELGLQDFEGRSYAGWHHHVTLVSAAQLYRMLDRRRRRQWMSRPDGPHWNESAPRPRSSVDRAAGRPQTTLMKECVQ
jgi:hypothetical protein